MSKEELFEEILRLPLEERLELREAINEYPGFTQPDPHMTLELRAELERRHQDMLDHPEDECSWEEACARLDKRRGSRKR